MDRALPVISYVNFQSLDPDHPLTVCAQLRVPAGTTDRLPAVVIAHGSTGVDSRGAFHAAALNAVGIATLEMDMWAVRAAAVLFFEQAFSQETRRDEKPNRD